MICLRASCGYLLGPQLLESPVEVSIKSGRQSGSEDTESLFEGLQDEGSAQYLLKDSCRAPSI